MIVFVTLVILTALIYTICAYRHSRKLIYVESNIEPGQYHLLNSNEGSTNNLVISESEEDQVQV